jgi:hypothetical protein
MTSNKGKPKPPGLTVAVNKCVNCLFGPDRIVDGERAREIVRSCREAQTYFVCHHHNETVCRAYYDEFGHEAQMIRIAERLGLVSFIEQDTDMRPGVEPDPPQD